MGLSFRDGIAVLQLLVFIPCLLTGAYLCFRHGFSKAGGSLLIVTFTLTRTIGASCQLAATNNPSTGVITAELVCLYIGLSPLTVLCWGILSRVNAQITQPIPPKVYKLTGIASLVGLALGIYGAIKASHSWKTHPASWNNYSKAAVIIFVLVFIATVLAFLYLCTQYRSAPRVERRVYPAVLVCIPLIAVRLIYALLGEWSNDLKWNPYFGNTTLYLCLAVLEEIVAVLVLVLVGLSLPSYREQQKRAMQDTEMKRSPNGSGSDLSGGQGQRWPRENY